MADTDRQTRSTHWRNLLARVRETVSPLSWLRVPDYGPEAPEQAREQWLRQLTRTRDLLEQARDVVDRGGWTGGGAWFTVREVDGRVRKASLAESFALRSPAAPVAGACLVAIMIRLAEDPDRVPAVDDVWHAVDELHEAMHETLGHDAAAPGRAYAVAQRRAHLRSLTAWNDEPGRTSEQVLDLFDRAIARTIIGSVA
jgi:hypothetical protein